MPTITESRLKSGLLTVGGQQFATQASNVTLSPDTKEEGDTLEVLSGDTILPSETTSWSLQIEAVQDFASPAGFCAWAMANAGDLETFTWRPGPAGASPTYTGTLRVRAVEIGGDVNSRLSTSAEWPCQGAPVVTYPAA